MSIRETLVLANDKSGMVIVTALAGSLRLVVLIMAVILFVMSLSSEISYKTEFRAAVVVMALGMILLVGPRQEILLIRDENVIKITRRFFLFSKTAEVAMNAASVAIDGKAIVLSADGKSYPIRVAGKKPGMQELFEKMKEVIQESKS